jgi:bifunctional UDP-N-acetylglucosamine pyrophosphorylase/glucosamine-1-phosphate N-acetyltransferase
MGGKAKALLRLAGRPLVLRVLDTVKKAGVGRTIVVVGHRAADVVRALPPGTEWVVQRRRLGTGHALGTCCDNLGEFRGALLVLYCDNPFVTPGVLRRLVQHHRRHRAGATLLSVHLPEPGDYGRIVRDGSGKVQAIVEAKEASPQQLAIREVNAGVYCFQSPLVFQALKRVRKSPVKGEYYLTDVVGVLASAGHRVEGRPTRIRAAAVGINTPEELALAESIIATRRRGGAPRAGRCEQGRA